MDVDVISQPSVLILVVDALAQRTEVVNARDALDTGLLVEQVVNLIHAHARLADEVEDDARVNVTGTGTHRQAGQRGQAHRGIDGAAIADSRSGSTIAQVEGDLVGVHRVAAQEGRYLLGDELVRGAVDAITFTAGVLSLSNMAMACGKLGRLGCGVNPIRGQNNVQGACDMGGNPGDFPGYQKFATPGVFEKFEQAWGTELNRTMGMYATDVFPAAIEGTIKAAFMFGEDPVRTDPDIHHVVKALEALEFFVVDELFMTETARYADVILPGRSYAEKEGTFTNTERRIQRVRKAVDVAGDTRLDTDIFTDLMNRMGYPQPRLTAAQIMDEVAAVDPAYAGVSHARLDSDELRGRGLQWPCTAPDHPGTPILHVGSFTRGLGMFKAERYRPSAEAPDADYPLIMMTGRVLYQYNACAMTGRTEGCNLNEGASFIEVNSEDADRLGIADGDRVKVTSRRGSIESKARVSGKTNPGETWMPFHFEDGNSNWLTIAALDDVARVPEFKVCAVRVERA